MPRFEAQIWLPNEHPYQVETSAANIFAAKEIIARREGVDEKYVNRLFTIDEDDHDTSSGSSQNLSGSEISLGGILGLVLFFGAAWILVNYWPYVITIGVIGMIIWTIKIFNE